MGGTKTLWEDFETKGGAVSRAKALERFGWQVRVVRNKRKQVWYQHGGGLHSYQMIPTTSGVVKGKKVTRNVHVVLARRPGVSYWPSVGLWKGKDSVRVYP